MKFYMQLIKPKTQSQLLSPSQGEYHFEIFPAQNKSTQVHRPTALASQSCATCHLEFDPEPSKDESDRVVFRD